jgi:hypothetical protein
MFVRIGRVCSHLPRAAVTTLLEACRRWCTMELAPATGLRTCCALPAAASQRCPDEELHRQGARWPSMGDMLAVWQRCFAAARQSYKQAAHLLLHKNKRCSGLACLDGKSWGECRRRQIIDAAAGNCSGDKGWMDSTRDNIC